MSILDSPHSDPSSKSQLTNMDVARNSKYFLILIQDIVWKEKSLHYHVDDILFLNIFHQIIEFALSFIENRSIKGLFLCLFWRELRENHFGIFGHHLRRNYENYRKWQDDTSFTSCKNSEKLLFV